MRKMFNILIALVLVLSLGIMAVPMGTVEAQEGPIDEPIKWSQPPDMGATGMDFYSEMPWILASDWLCKTGLPVTDFHWWGSWKDNVKPEGLEGEFNAYLMVFENEPSPPSHPLDGPVWEFLTYDFHEEVYGTDGAGNVVYQYTVYLPEGDWFDQEEGKIYWFALSIGSACAPYWGWHNTAEVLIDDSVYMGPGGPSDWHELLYPAGHEWVGQSADLAFEVSVPPPSEVWVDDDWDTASHGDSVDGHIFGYDAFATIQDGIDAVAGSTVNVANGTYTEQLTIDKSLTLQAGSSPVIDVSGFTGDGIKVTADNVIIDGFEIIGIPYGGSPSSNVNPTIAAEANYVTVQNCVFNTSGDALGKEAMLARPGTNHISFLNNEVNNYMFGISARGNGWGGSATLPDDGVTDLTVSGNTFNVGYVDTGASITGEAVQIHYGDDIVVTGNTINGPGTFESCTYDLINSIGIADFMSGYGAAGTITYSNNEITNCYVGIGTFAGNGEIIGNTVTGNNIGIQVGQNDAVYISTPATGVAITGNDIQNNIRGIWAQNFVVDGLAAHFNNIVGNTEYGVINEDPENDEFDALYNWWGDETGPSHDLNLGGQGDTVSDNVDFSPWLYKTQEQFVSGAPCYAGSVVLDNEATLVDTTSYAGGWNSFSTPVTLDSSANTVSELLALTAGSGLVIERAQCFNLTSQEWVPVIMGGMVVKDYQIKPGEGLFIQIRSKGSIPILVKTTPTSPPMRYLVAGWNLIGMSSLGAETVATALSGVYYSVVLSPKPPNDVAWSVPPDGADKELLLGEAYWVAMGQPGILFGFTTTPVADNMTWELNQ